MDLGDSNIFAGRLAFLIDENDELNKKRVAEATGISAGNLTEYTQGKKKPTADTLIKLGNFFDVSIDYLLGVDKDVNTMNGNVTGGNFVQGGGTITVNGHCPREMSIEESDLFRIFNSIDGKKRNKLLSLAYLLEDETNSFLNPKTK